MHLYIFIYEMHINTAHTRVYMDKSTIYFNNGTLFTGKCSCSLSYPAA